MQRVLAIVRGPADRDARLLTLATLVTTFGTGAYLTCVTLYLTRSVGMAPSAVGLGLTLGGLFGLVAGVVLGDQADRRGAREVIVVATLLDAVATCAMVEVHGLATLAAAAAGVAIGRAGASSARGALIALIAGADGAGALRSYLRAVTNVGLSVGTLGAAVVLAADTRTAYVAMLVADAATSVAAAALILRLPRRPPTRVAARHDERRWIALGDAPYVAFTLAASIASLQYFVMTVSLPLWVTLHTAAPRWIVAVLLFVACLVVAALQVPATRRLRGRESAGRMVAGAGPLFCVAWLLIVVASVPPAAGAVALLLVAIVVHSMGEVRQVAGAFELSFVLARPDAHGQYQGVFGLAIGLAEVVAPALLVLLCITWGLAGWIVLMAIVTLAGWACARIERWAARRAPGGSGADEMASEPAVP